MKMSCHNAKNQMLPFLSGELSLAEVPKIQRHLDECPACAQYAVQIEAAQERLQNALGSAVTAPPTLDARVMATIRNLPPRRASFYKSQPVHQALKTKIEYSIRVTTRNLAK